MTFAPGQPVATVAVIVDDTSIEPDETLINATIGPNPTITVAITDNDPRESPPRSIVDRTIPIIAVDAGW